MFETFLPASTGIGCGNLDGAALVAGAIAMKPKRAGVRAEIVESPLQAPAMAYKSSFSRAAEIIGPDGRQLFISGTASIKPNSHDVAYVGDIEKQVDCTMTAVLAVCGVHFCRANNHLKFRRYFSSRDLRETIAASLADSTIYLCWGLLILIVNRFALDLFGQALLPVVALAASVVEFSIVFDGVGEALIPLGGMYDGEGNRPALRELAGHSAFVATVEGAVCGAAFFVLAPLVAAAYGIRGEAAGLLPQAVTMIRTEKQKAVR